MNSETPESTGRSLETRTAVDRPSVYQWREYLPLVLVLGLVAAVYFPGLTNEFVWVDHSEIIEKKVLIRSPQDLVELLWDDHNPDGYYRPVYNAIQSLDAVVWGLNPFGFHLSSLALHLLNVALAFFLARYGGFRSLWAGLLAGLWALHPVNSATVGLVHAKADLLVVSSLGGSLLLFLRGQRSQMRWPQSWSWSLALLFVGLYAKENAFLYPAAFISFFLLRSRGTAQPRRLQLYASIVVTVAVLAITHRFLVLPLDVSGSSLDLQERMLTFLTVYSDYAFKLFLFVDASVVDTVTQFSAMESLPRGLYLLSALLLSGIQLFLVVKVPRLRKWILLYNLALLPVAQIIPTLHFREDRFLYLPSLGFVALCVEGASLAVERAHRRGFLPRMLARSVVPILVLIGLGCGMLTLREVRTFENDETFLLKEVRRNPDFLEGLSHLGKYYERRGEYERAERYYRACLASRPGIVSYVDRDGLILNFSFTLLAQGKAQEAYDLIEQRGDEVGQAAHRAHLSYNRAVAAFKLGRHDEALAGFRAYGVNHPDDADCQFLTGVCAMRLGANQVARDAFEAYLFRNPRAHDRPLVEKYLRTIDQAK